MTNARSATRVIVGCVLLLGAQALRAQDWPQWRGANRDNKVAGFTEIKDWPKTLTQKWKVTVGEGVASLALVGDKVYAFTRQGDDEVIRCLNAEDGKEVWKEKYPGPNVKEFRGDKGYPGPRSSPAVGDGKVCALGVGGVLTCLDAANGKVLWRKDPKSVPMFHTSSSPLITDGKCVAFIGGQGRGELAAYDLTSGEAKWKWTNAGPPYGSPVLMTVDGKKMVVTLTDRNTIVGIGLDDGKELWKANTAAGGGPGRYNTSTPVVDGDTVIYVEPGGGTTALKIEKKDDGFAAKELWKVAREGAAQYNTPVLKDGKLYGLSGGGRGATNVFCMDAKTGKVLWTDKTSRGQCGAILDVGPVLVGLSSNSDLFVFKPSDKEYQEVTRYKVADSETWAEPVLAGKRVFVKDRDALILWTID
jgi:outer membrane protein assembly factor BamB